MRWLMKVSVAALAIVSAPAPAAAGGNWIEWDRDWYLPGQVVAGEMQAYAKDIPRLEAGGPYFAYLLPKGTGWAEAPGLPSGARIAGWVELLGRKWWEGGWIPMVARVSLAAPAEPGEYLVAICNRPCTHPLGDVDTTSLRVFNSAEDAYYVPLLEKARTKARRLEARLTEAKADADAARDRAESTAEYAGRLADDVSVLEARLRGTGRPPAGEAPVLTWFLVPAALFGYTLGRRRKRRPEPVAEPIDQVVEMLLVEEPKLELSRRP